jgi:iron complex transport system permease protein
LKAILDLDQLLADAEISSEQHVRLRKRALRDSATLGYGLLAGFGMAAIAASVIAMVPSGTTTMLVGLLAAGAGGLLRTAGAPRWHSLSTVWTVLGALLAAGGLLISTQAAAWSFLVAAVGLGLLAVVLGSHLLVVLGMLSLASALGARTGYFHASYFLGVDAPLLTAVSFSLFTGLVYVVHRRASAAYAGLALTAARTGVLLVNLALWVGSLFGDDLGVLGLDGPSIPAWAFALVWALALGALAAWGWHVGRRWVVNHCAVFGTIHLFTQWFERLGAEPLSVLIAGVLLVGLALALRAYNRDPADGTE